MPDGKHTRRLFAVLYIALALLGAYLLVKYALRWALPFLTAFLISRLVEPPVRLLTQRFRMRRALASAICVSVTFAVAITLFSLCIGRIVYELASFAKDVPALLRDVTDLFSAADSKLRGFILTSPPEVQEYLTAALNGLSSKSADMLTSLSRGILGFLSGMAQSTPGILIFLFTTGVSAFFISSGYREITAFIMKQIPQRNRELMLTMNADMRGAFGKWVRAQLMLAGVTFGELCVLFLLLRIDFSVLLALALAFLDMLPVLGVGMALVPWGIISLLGGDAARGFTLLAGYGAIMLIRNVLEPKIVGAQLGLPPIAALAAMYVGFCTAGIIGMALFPLGLILVIMLNERRVIKLWK